MPLQTKPRPRHKVLNWATVNVDDRKELAKLDRLEQKRAGELARKAVAELRALGIIDKHGRRIKKELPPDMREDSECDL